MRTVTLLLLIGFLNISCEKNEKSELPNEINGSWKVIKLDIEGQLLDVGPQPDDAHHADIAIEIPDSSTESITGNTFRNTIWVHFERNGERQIKFYNYGGTRLSEDEWGMHFGEHLRNTITFSLTEYKLTLFNKKNQPIIIFNRQ